MVIPGIAASGGQSQYYATRRDGWLRRAWSLLVRDGRSSGHDSIPQRGIHSKSATDVGASTPLAHKRRAVPML